MNKYDKLVELNEQHKQSCNLNNIADSSFTITKKGGHWVLQSKYGSYKKITSYYDIDIVLNLYEYNYITNISKLKNIPHLDRCILTHTDWTSILKHCHKRPIRNLQIKRVSDLKTYVAKKALLHNVLLIEETMKYIILLENDKDLLILSDYILKVTDETELKFLINAKSITIENLDISDVTDLSLCFYDSQNVEKIILRNFDTGNVTICHSMFRDCYKLRNLDISCFDTRKIKDFSYMFTNCVNLEQLDISCFDTSSATTMRGMFSGCINLKKLDLNHFNTERLMNVSFMFLNCKNLTELKIDKWKLLEKTDIYIKDMFKGCINLKSITTIIR